MSLRRKLLFTALLLLLLFGLAEGSLRVAYFIYRGSWNFAGIKDLNEKLYLPHPYTCFALKPEVTIETYASIIHINRWGNRGPDQPYEKPPDTVRIVCLGGSTTFCIYASDDAHTWAARLEAKLSEHYAPRRIEVLNYSAPGYNSAESLTTFALRAIDRDPDVVIVHHGWNDLTAATDPGLVSDYTHRRKAGAGSSKGWWLDLATYRLALLARERWRKTYEPKGSMEGLSQQAVGIYERNLESIILLAKPRHIEPVLVTMASKLPGDDDPQALAKVSQVEPLILRRRLTPAGLHRAVRALNDCMRRLAERHGVLLVDLGNTFPREERLFGDFGHKTDEGLELFAQLVAEAIIENGVIDRIQARPVDLRASTP